MDAVLAQENLEPATKKKCGKCGSTDRVKTVQIVHKGSKRKNTVQIKLCIRCRGKLH